MGETANSAIMVGHFNTLFSKWIEQLGRRSARNRTLEQHSKLAGPNGHLQNIPPPREYIFFSRAHGTFSRIDHMVGHVKSQ